MSDNTTPRATGEAVAWDLYNECGRYDLTDSLAMAKEWEKTRGNVAYPLYRHPAPRESGEAVAWDSGMAWSLLRDRIRDVVDEIESEPFRSSGYEFRSAFFSDWAREMTRLLEDRFFTHPAPRGRVVTKALSHLLRYAERQQCTHEETSRRGHIWTVCSMCGKKWADDESGFVPYVEPVEITNARDALALVDADAGEVDRG